ncbi:glycoside hydrolase family 3 N-terminal domain-containing protein [Stackebrandtia soli]|uniref:glycoside hydrolase family 3 N-terminal domain-containing protein n=1 Tax=Stackebrandtia soli TaxID=1892856 RepID=UPI0039EBC0F3
MRTKALRTLIPGFSGTTAPRWVVDLLDEGIAGFCLFSYNIDNPDQVAELTAQLRTANPNALVAIDEEGGDVTRLHTATGSPYPGNAALGAVDDPELTRAIHHAIGAELRDTGFNLNFAPAVDVNVEDDNPVIGTRSFGRDPHAVARHAAAAVTGLHQAGVLACAKHFPGHGATSVDSHFELPTVDVTIDVLRERELVPFRAVIGAGIRMIMSGHIRVPALTGQRPATLSRAAMHDLLRGELGFDGAIITDAIEMRGVSGDIGLPAAVVEALIAGCDLICTGGEMQKDGPLTDVVNETVDAIVAAVDEGRLPLSRLEAANRRVTELFDGVTDLGDAQSALGLSAARRALRLEGELPAWDNPLIIQIDSAANIAVGEAPWGITPLLTKRLPDVDVLHADQDGPGVEALTAAARGRAVVIVARDSHRTPHSREIITALAGCSRAVLVEMGWPAPWRAEGLTAYLATYGAASANATAAVEVLLGD